MHADTLLDEAAATPDIRVATRDTVNPQLLERAVIVTLTNLFNC